jgi:hypothetical protein
MPICPRPLGSTYSASSRPIFSTTCWCEKNGAGGSRTKPYASSRGRLVSYERRYSSVVIKTTMPSSGAEIKSCPRGYGGRIAALCRSSVNCVSRGDRDAISADSSRLYCWGNFNVVVAVGARRDAGSSFGSRPRARRHRRRHDRRRHNRARAASGYRRSGDRPRVRYIGAVCARRARQAGRTRAAPVGASRSRRRQRRCVQTPSRVRAARRRGLREHGARARRPGARHGANAARSSRRA